jgi:uncharacterized protein CbrC (UPF0167 family)
MKAYHTAHGLCGWSYQERLVHCAGKAAVVGGIGGCRDSGVNARGLHNTHEQAIWLALRVMKVDEGQLRACTC